MFVIPKTLTTKLLINILGSKVMDGIGSVGSVTWANWWNCGKVIMDEVQKKLRSDSWRGRRIDFWESDHFGVMEIVDKKGVSIV